MQTAQVFIPHDEHVWVTGEILVNADAKGNVEVKINDEVCPTERTSKVINLTKLGLQGLPSQNIGIPVHGVEDMTTLPFLHEPAILDNLKRY